MALQNDIRYCRFEIKATGEDGSFEGYASVYGNVDRSGEMVLPGAFTKTLSEQSTVPVLWQHDQSEPIGRGELTDTGTGLIVKGNLILSVGRAREAYDLLKGGAVKGLSIGYRVVKDAWEKGTRQLTELKLYEVSVVTLPANELATVMSVKAGRKLSADSIATIQAAIESLESLLEDAGVPEDVGETPTPMEADSKSAEPAKGHSELTLAVERLLRA